MCWIYGKSQYENVRVDSIHLLIWKLATPCFLTNLSPSVFQGLHRGVWDEDDGAEARTWASGCRLQTLPPPHMEMGQPTHSSRASQRSKPTMGPHGSPSSSTATITQNPGACSVQGAPTPQLQEVGFKATDWSFLFYVISIVVIVNHLWWVHSIKCFLRLQFKITSWWWS